MDLRLPIGGLFSIFGFILSVYGIAGPSDIYGPSLGININLLWGAVMLIFGITMAGLAISSRKPLGDAVEPDVKES